MQQSSHAQPSDGYHAWFFDGCDADTEETAGASDGGPEFELAEGPELERFKVPPPEETPSAARPRLRFVSLLDDAHEKKGDSDVARGSGASADISGGPEPRTPGSPKLWETTTPGVYLDGRNCVCYKDVSPPHRRWLWHEGLKLMAWVD